MASARASTKTMLDEFYRVAFRKKLSRRLAALPADADQWLRRHEVRTPPGPMVVRQDADADLP